LSVIKRKQTQKSDFLRLILKDANSSANKPTNIYVLFSLMGVKLL